MGRFKAFDYMAQTVVGMCGMTNAKGKRGFAMSFDRRIQTLYDQLKIHRDEMKTFYVTSPTIRRAGAIELDSVTPEMLSYLCNKPSWGMVLHAPDDDKISYLYSITPAGIFIEVFLGKANGWIDNDEQLSKHFVGTIIATNNEVTCTPNSSYHFITKYLNSDNPDYYLKNTSLVDSYYTKQIKKVFTEIKGLKGKMVDNDKVAFQAKDAPYTVILANECNEKTRLLQTALKTFLFIFTSNVNYCERISEDGKREGYRNNNTKDYILVDAGWDMDINVINPFSVSGHFRLQPYGEGRNERKLIYIDSYMKHGYHRRPGKDILNEEK